MKAIPKTKAKPGKRQVARTTKPRVVRSGAKSYGERQLSRILRLLRAELPDLQTRYKVKSLGVFGSFVRKDATKKSDLDVLIEFEDYAGLTLFGFAGIENELSDLLGIKVDLVDKKMLRSPISENVMKEVVMV